MTTRHTLDTPSLTAMYQDRLLAEYRSPANRRELVDPTHSAERKNPVCGDAVRIMVRVANGALAEVAFTGQACSVATASASLLTQSTANTDPAAALRMVADVEAMLTGARAEDLPELLAPLRGAIRFSARHSCVLLPWLTLRDALK